MGNQQSNEKKPNYKVYKITSTDERSDWTRCYLDDYVPYSNGNYKHMDFKNELITNPFLMVLAEGVTGCSLPETAILEKGYYMAIDIDMTRNSNSNDNFSLRSAKTVGRGDHSSLWEGGFQGVVGDIAEARERYARASEWANFDKQAQQTWQLQPPKK